jgi:hypothetical protein
MVRRRERQGVLNQEALNQMTDEERLQTYFANGGYMSKEGFGWPAPISQKKRRVCLSLNMLLSTKNGQRLLIKTLDAFYEGKIDKFGQPVKKAEVIRRKPRFTKKIESPPLKASVGKLEGKGGKSGKSGQTQGRAGM